MATAANKSKAAESEKDVKAAGTDTSKTTQTTKQAEEKDVATGAEKREATSEEITEGAKDGNLGVVPDGQSDVFEDYSEYDEDDFEDGGNFDGASGTVPEKSLDGHEYDAPYTYLSGSDLKPRTSDSDDPAKSWTAQEAGGERADEDGNLLDPVALVPVENIPGQTFRASELPNREVAEAAGVDYDQWVAGLPVRVDVPDEAPRKGIPA